MTQGRLESVASSLPAQNPEPFLTLVSRRSMLVFHCDMMLPYPSPTLIRRWAACVISIVLLHCLHKYVKHQQSYTALRESQTTIPTSVTNDAGPAPLLDSVLQSPPTLDQLIASNPDHYPPWNGYKDKDYDPNHWHVLPL